MRIIKYLVIIIAALPLLNSCRKIEQLPPAPLIKFTRFAVFDTTTLLGKYKAGRLDFYFEDGDGDLGLQAPSGNMTDTTNLYLTLFRKTGGIMAQAPDNDPLKPLFYRIPFMERLGQNKILKGTISVTFLYLSYYPGDTIRYDFYIKDRALNESNVASTSEIVVSANDIYTK